MTSYRTVSDVKAICNVFCPVQMNSPAVLFTEVSIFYLYMNPVRFRREILRKEKDQPTRYRLFCSVGEKVADTCGTWNEGGC